MPRRLTSILSLPLMWGAVTFLPAAAQQSDQPKFPPSPHIAPTEALKPERQLMQLQVPPGFEIQLVAAEPDIKNPMNIAFDAKGRLWVTMSSEYPFPAKSKKTRDTVKILEDFGPDGKARKITTFADNLNIPIGVLPLGNGAIVFSIPNVYYMEDTDGDGKADTKKILLKEYGFRDTHGLTGEFRYGFDGWIYACHGFSNTSTVKGTDGSTITMHSGNTYRFKPDGSNLQYFTHGQVNPFGLTFDPLGNLYSCDCHTRPIYQLLQGAYYPSFGKPHDGIGFGPEMMTHSHGSTAIAGIAYYAADHFPREFHDNIFIGNVVTNRINRDSLKQVGSTYKAIAKPDFVVSKDRWFRPVDIKLGPDGALYVADFYNRIIGHYEVPLTHPGRDRDHGRIWRIVYRGPNGAVQPNPPRADWTAATVDNLIADLAHPNLTVRLIATHELVRRGGQKVMTAVLKEWNPNAPLFQRIHGLWVLERLGALGRHDILTRAAAAKESALRVHAMRVLSENSKWSANERNLALKGLHDNNAFVQRAAAQALANHPHVDHVFPLLKLRYSVPQQDTHLTHAVRMALRDQMNTEDTWILLLKKNQQLREKDIRALADVSLGSGAPFVAGFLAANLQILREDGKRFSSYVRFIARHGNQNHRALLLDFGQKQLDESPLKQAAVLKTIYQGTQEAGRKLEPEARLWGRRLTKRLFSSKSQDQVLAGIDLAGLLRISDSVSTLTKFIHNTNQPIAYRSESAHSLMMIDPKGSIPLLTKELADPKEPFAFHEAVAKALAKDNHPAALAELVLRLETASARLQKVIAKELAGSRRGADQLLQTVAKGKASPRLLLDRTVRLLVSRANPPNWKKRLADLTKGLPPADAELLSLLKNRISGYANAKPDSAAGAKVFMKHCAACHQINNQGGKIAPQLDGVGQRGIERLLEDILDPNRNIDQQFRATTLELKNGQFFTGLFLRQEGEVFIMADNEGKEKRFAKEDVVKRFVSRVSPMPANVAEKMSANEIYDLLAFLMEQQPVRASAK